MYFFSLFIYLFNAYRINYLLNKPSLEQTYLFNKIIIFLVLILFPQKHFLSMTAGGSIISQYNITCNFLGFAGSLMEAPAIKGIKKA